MRGFEELVEEKFMLVILGTIGKKNVRKNHENEL
jgi:hypothetical protein